jgi:hypothetical protein
MQSPLTALAERIGSEAARDAFLAKYRDLPGDFCVNLCACGAGEGHPEYSRPNPSGRPATAAS